MKKIVLGNKKFLFISPLVVHKKLPRSAVSKVGRKLQSHGAGRENIFRPRIFWNKAGEMVKSE
jgi:hypothetical protein